MTEPVSLTHVRYPPRPFDGRHRMKGGQGGQRLAGAALGLVWLPAGCFLAFLAASGQPEQLGPVISPDLVLLAPAGLLLALAVGAMRRRGRARTA